MAGNGDDEEDLAGATHEPRECMACRGTGRVISNLGGSPSTVDCPWCNGTGLRPAEVDAQAHWADRPRPEQQPAGESPAEPAEKPGEESSSEPSAA